MDEDYRYVLVELKKAINDLLRRSIQEKYPFKPSSEITEILNEKRTGFIEELYCQQMIKFLYDKKDSEAILNKLRPYFQQKTPTTHQ